MKKNMIEKDLSGCEKLIMKILWDSKEDISTPEMIGLLKERYGKDYARTTVVTFVQRLMEKGYVSTYRKGNVSYIHALQEEQQYTDHFLKSIKDFWFKGDCSNLLSALCRSDKLTKDEIERMRKLMDEMDD